LHIKARRQSGAPLHLVNQNSSSSSAPPVDTHPAAAAKPDASPLQALPPGEEAPFRAALNALLARAARVVLPLYLVAVLAACGVDLIFARGPAAPVGTWTLTGWALVLAPLIALVVAAHRRQPAPHFGLALLLGLAISGAGWIVLRAASSENQATVADGAALGILFVVLLAAAQSRLRIGLLLCAGLWGLYGWTLAARGGTSNAAAIAAHLQLLQALGVGSALSLILGRLARAEFSARRTLTVHRDRFERIKQSRTRFIAAASHDLRQPLHAMAFLSQALRARLHDDPAEAVLRRLEQAAQSTDHMIRDLLELTKLDAGAIELRLQPVPLRLVFENVHTEFARPAHEKGLSFHVYKTDLACRSDPVALQRIVANLVSNAIRYTDSGVIYLRAEARDGEVRIRVRDTGIGIAPGDCARLFEEFHQVRKDRGGTGLGLAICKRLSDALGHRLEVESAPGKGSAFTLVAPQLVRAAQQAQPSQDAPLTRILSEMSPSAPALAGSVVVLVDEDSARRRAVRPVIESWGASVVDAGSGAEAEEKLSGILTTPDLMIVDGDLTAGENSDQVIARLQDAYGKVIPSLVVTGNSVEVHSRGKGTQLPLDSESLERALISARNTVPRRPPPG
jgi:signal transduction histidine kinase/CheY-like chemotaxis protein